MKIRISKSEIQNILNLFRSPQKSKSSIIFTSEFVTKDFDLYYLYDYELISESKCFFAFSLSYDDLYYYASAKRNEDIEIDFSDKKLRIADFETYIYIDELSIDCFYLFLHYRFYLYKYDVNKVFINTDTLEILKKISKMMKHDKRHQHLRYLFVLGNSLFCTDGYRLITVNNLNLQNYNDEEFPISLDFLRFLDKVKTKFVEIRRVRENERDKVLIRSEKILKIEDFVKGPDFKAFVKDSYSYIGKFGVNDIREYVEIDDRYLSDFIDIIDIEDKEDKINLWFGKNVVVLEKDNIAYYCVARLKEKEKEINPHAS